MKKTVTFYLYNTYEAYCASEKGINANTIPPIDTLYYKHELLEKAEVELPEGYYSTDDGQIVDSDGYVCRIFSEKRGKYFATYLAPFDYKKEEIVLKIW